MTDYSDLIARLEKAEGGDRELDAKIDAVIFGGKPAHEYGRDTPAQRLRNSYGADVVFLNPDETENGGHVLGRHWRVCPPYSASLDVAVTLAEKMLPRWSLRLSLGEGYRFPCATMGRSYPFNAAVAVEHSASSAVAVLLAILHALRHEAFERMDAA